MQKCSPPGDVAETRGFALYVPQAKKVLKACHARHTARIAPKPPQREPDGRIVPTPPDVWDKGASTKRCVRGEKKITNIHTHITSTNNAACKDEY